MTFQDRDPAPDFSRFTDANFSFFVFSTSEVFAGDSVKIPGGTGGALKFPASLESLSIDRCVSP